MIDRVYIILLPYYLLLFLLHIPNKLYPLQHNTSYPIPSISPHHTISSHHINKLYCQPSPIHPPHQMPSTYPKTNSNQGYTSLSSTPRNASIDFASNTTPIPASSNTKSKKWFNPIVSNLLKITPEPPVNPWAADPFCFSSHQGVKKGDSATGSEKGDFRPDQRRGYLGRKKVVGWVL
jgi:hypothetical protein